MAPKILSLVAVLILADGISSMNLKREEKTEGVFPLREAEQLYASNKNEVQKRIEAGEPFPADCKCAPFDADAVKQGTFFCPPGEEPAKTCDVRCGCEAWLCRMADCSALIKANFSGPCLDEKTGGVDACQARTKEQWSCGCLVKTCWKDDCVAKEARIQASFKCDPKCSSQALDKCKCKKPVCIPNPLPAPKIGKCEKDSDCKNAKCFGCAETTPLGPVCAGKFPVDHVRHECTKRTCPAHNCDVCKGQRAVVNVDPDECGCPTYRCEQLPVPPCKPCEKPKTIQAENCPKGYDVCVKNEKFACHEPKCDFCREELEVGNVVDECGCQNMKCVTDGLPKKLDSKLPCRCHEEPVKEKVKNHHKCKALVTVCKKVSEPCKNSTAKCDHCRQEVEVVDEDKCGCPVVRCRNLLPTAGPVPTPHACGPCQKEVQIPIRKHPKCHDTKPECQDKAAVYKIVEDKSEIPEKKRPLYELATEDIIKKMEPEEFKKALKKVEGVGPVAVLKGDKVVVKVEDKVKVFEVKPKSEIKPTTAKPGEPTAKPGQKVPKKKVYVYIPDKCPKKESSLQCQLKAGESAHECKCHVDEHVDAFVCDPITRKCPISTGSECFLVEPDKTNGKCNDSKLICTNCTKYIEEDYPKTEKCSACAEREVVLKKDPVTKCLERIAGECKPSPCKIPKCVKGCSRAEPTGREDKCGCIGWKCVPLTTCETKCKKCESCVSVIDVDLKCNTFKCEANCSKTEGPKEFPLECYKRAVEMQDNKVIPKVDECGCPQYIKKCPVLNQVISPKGCQKGFYPCGEDEGIKVKDGCGCSLCDPQCCCACPPVKKDKCGDCEEPVTETSHDGFCKQTVCKKVPCVPLTPLACPSCSHKKISLNSCQCPEQKCVKTKCPSVKKCLHKGEKPVTVKDKCNCDVLCSCTKGALCAGQQVCLKPKYSCEKCAPAPTSKP